MPKVRKVNVAGVARLPAFCHAAVVGDDLLVSGMLGELRMAVLSWFTEESARKPSNLSAT